MSYEKFFGGLGQSAPSTTLRVGQKPSLQAVYAGKAMEIKNQIAMYESGGPYHLLEFNSPDYKSFMLWMQMYYEQDMAKRQSIATLRPVPQLVLDNIKKETGEDIIVPDWMKTGIKIQESEWRLFVECRDRALKMVREQGSTFAASDSRGFAEWWKKYDACGFSGFFATSYYGEQLNVTGVPAGLYNFYLQTKGSQPPPANLLGKGSDILSWAKQNWMLLGLGAVGGLVVVRILKQRRATARSKASLVEVTRNSKGLKNPLDKEGVLNVLRLFASGSKKKPEIERIDPTVNFDDMDFSQMFVAEIYFPSWPTKKQAIRWADFAISEGAFFVHGPYVQPVLSVNHERYVMMAHFKTKAKGEDFENMYGVESLPGKKLLIAT